MTVEFKSKFVKSAILPCSAATSFGFRCSSCNLWAAVGAKPVLPIAQCCHRYCRPGVSQLLVAVNKMDTVDWSKDRYDEIVRKLGAFLRQTGFKDSDVSFVPCSGLVGDNLASAPPAGHRLCSWYTGPTLAEQIGK